MEVKFNAAIKSVMTKQFVSGDCGTRLVIEKDSMPPDQLAKLNAMFSSHANRSQQLTITIDSGLTATDV